MTPNQKLTDVIQGRPVADFENANGTVSIRFQDGTLMRVRATAETMSAVPRGAKVTQVADGGGELELRLEDGSTVSFTLSDPRNAVSVWDPAGKVLYLG
jgi:pyruvate/2-oxoglutarate dehydrogenase complex dihydrolipoamide acyltransferase (E2) component